MKLVKIAEDHGFNQLVNEPTRIQGSTENILDLVFSNNSSSIYKTSVVDSTADHGNVLVDVNITPTRKRKVKRKVFLREKADTASISKALKDSFPVYERDYFWVSLWKLNGTGSNRRSTTSWTRLFLIKLHPPVTVYPGSVGLFDVRFRKKQRLYNIAKASHRRSDWDIYNNFRRQVQKEAYVLLNLAMLHLLLKLHSLTSQKCFGITSKISARMTTVWQI